MTGRIFSIEEFSTFDGPGIRMSVFLKGCPLRCTWCHNPEGQRREYEYVKRHGDCLGCGNCLKYAEGIGKQAHYGTQSAQACPKGLIRLCGEDFTPLELCERIFKNETVLRMNGGGVTFSGGEPLMQADFVVSCMRILRPRVHCAIQTCGYAAKDLFSQILTMCDYVLYDLKLMDPVLHRRFCGADPALIFENYRLLVHSGVPFITRVPLIPGVTDTEQNLSQIATFLANEGVEQIELLPYNKMAGGKYAGLLRTYQPGFDEIVTSQPHCEIFARMGIAARVL